MGSRTILYIDGGRCTHDPDRNLPNAVLWVEYHAALSASGGSGAYEWNIEAGRLPSGIRLNKSTGELSGTAWEIGTFSVTVSLADINNIIVVSKISHWLWNDSHREQTLAAGKAGVQYSDTLTSLGGVSPYTWSVISGRCLLA